MLARIKFASYSNSNKLNENELKRLEKFLGEKLESSKMKVGDDGKFENVGYKETFDKAKAEKDSEYTLVYPADMYQISDTNNFIVDLERFTSQFPTIEITIKGVPKSVSNDHKNLIDTMNKVADKIEDAKNRFDKVVEYNQKCEVHVPGLGLLNLNRVAYATDYCTVELQSLLHQGWRIIAVCPQPDQRRPDYILGMNVSDMTSQVDVEHFSGRGKEE